MAGFIHSILRPDALVAADGEETIDLPVNPLSVVLLKISPLNDTGTLANYSYLEGLLSAVDNIRINYKGTAVLDMRGVDAAALAILYHKAHLWQSNPVETDNDRRTLVLPLFLGRKPYVEAECFPRTARGELSITTTWDMADTGFDTLRRSIETIELPNANPAHFERKTTLASTFTVTGEQDVDLPVGNTIRAIQLFGTTGYAGAAPVPTWGRVELLINNLNRLYSSSDWEGLRGILGILGVEANPTTEHRHGFNDAAAGQVFTRHPHMAPTLDDNYALMHLDPTMDDLHSLDTANAGRCHIRVNVETADAFRAVVVERVSNDKFLTGARAAQ